jgi:F-type H+-transporting ATPase subunit b
MPQIEQLPFIYASQIFWLVVVFGILLVGIGYGMLPKIQSTVEARDAQIASDLATAEQARAEADRTEAAYRARMEESRAEALKVTAAAKQAGARESEERIRTADQAIQVRTEAAEAQIRAASEAAMGEIETVAADAAQDLVTKLAGVSVSRERAAEAVRAALSNG